MNNNYLVSVALACLLGMNPIIAETQIGRSKQSLFKTLLEDFRCMRQKGFKRCAPQQKKRMVKAGTGLAIVLLSASGLGIWFSVGRLGGVKLDPVEGDEAEKKEEPQSSDSEEDGQDQEDEEEQADPEKKDALRERVRGFGSKRKKSQKTGQGVENEDEGSQLLLTESVEEREARALRKQVADQGDGEVDQDYLDELGDMLAESTKEGEENSASDAAEDEDDKKLLSIEEWEALNKVNKEAANAT